MSLRDRVLSELRTKKDAANRDVVLKKKGVKFDLKAKPSPKAAALAAVMQKALGKKADTNSVYVLGAGKFTSDVTEWIPTGFRDLDRILGGGWPIGRVSEVYGPEACGKSAITHMAIVGVQSIGGIAVIMDFERSLDGKKIRAMKIDTGRLIYATPKTIEEGWTIIEALYKDLKGKRDVPVLIIWDSVAGSMAKAELDNDISEQDRPGVVAQAMQKGCKRLFDWAPRMRAHILLVNQERDTFGGRSFVKEHHTPGGRQIKYCASIRLRMVRIATLPNKGKPKTGYLLKAMTQKCKLVPPHQESNWVLDFKYGPSEDITIFQKLVDTKLLRKVKGLFKAPWSKVTFKRRDWLERMEDESFRSAATATYEEVCLKEANGEISKFGEDGDDDDAEDTEDTKTEDNE